MARALEEIGRQSCCSSVTSIAINRVDGSGCRPAKTDEKTSTGSRAVADPPTISTTDLGCRPALFAKIFPFPSDANHLHISHRPVPQRGGSRSSRTRGGMRWTRRARLTRARSWTAKSCGPDIPTLISSLRGDDLAGDGGKKARLTEEITK